jgi:hypothetical protein
MTGVSPAPTDATGAAMKARIAGLAVTGLAVAGLAVAGLGR